MAVDRTGCFFLTLITALLLWGMCIHNPELFTRELPLKEGDLIPLFTNRFIRCFSCSKNHSYELPFCAAGDPIPIRKKSLGEIVAGDCFTRTQYELKFKVGTVGKILCEKTLTKAEVETFRLAVIEKPQYWMSFNNILFLTNVGFVDPINFPQDLGPRYYLVKHIDFYLLYNENQVVDIKSISDLHSAVNITEDAEITVNFTYSVFWKNSTIKSRKSISRTGAAIKIEWWNSEEKSGKITFKPVVFWVLNLFLGFSVLAVLIFKYLTPKISNISCSGPESSQPAGLHVPAYRWLLGAILGFGTQHLIMICFAFIFGFHDVFYRLVLGPRTTVLLVFSLLFSYLAYDVASCHRKQILNSNNGLAYNLPNIGIGKYIVMMFLTIVGVDQLAKWAFGSNNMIKTIAVTVVVAAASLWSWLMGARMAYSLNYQHPKPKIARKLKMVIPLWQKRLMTTPAQMFLGGLMPFLAIFTRMDEIYASLLSLKFCGASRAMLLPFLAVITLTLVLGAGFTGFQLKKRDFIWWWRSVLRGGSTAIFIFAYGIYFHCRVDQDSFANLYIFLVYNICLCCIFFAVLGATGFYASLVTYFLYNNLPEHGRQR